MTIIQCDYKKNCKNKSAKCWNCERNYENDVLEDNFEEKPELPYNAKKETRAGPKIDKRITPNGDLKYPSVKNWLDETNEMTK